MTYIIGYPDATVSNDCLEMFVEGEKIASILHPDDFFNQQYDSTQKFVVVVTRDMNLRKKIIDTINERCLQKDTYVHSTAVIHTSAKIEPGTIIYQFATALWNAHVEQDCLIAPYCMIAHESTVGQGSFLQPGVLIAGNTRIGKYCKFGLRSSAIDYLVICDFTVIGAGSLITKNTTQAGTYLGSPARKVAS